MYRYPLARECEVFLFTYIRIVLTAIFSSLFLVLRLSVSF